ncbi:MAG: YigZ family protein [Saprospiraceae bacterium]|nr:YigZ family protein [Saprospiraceae bacterium]|tara:strand:- start:1132 stop:1794 length:663 start_codon:yes stop_codon:yes gene_type:complete
MDLIIDEFKTIEANSEGLYKEKGSKFLSYLYHVQNEEEVTEKILNLKSIHPKSRHICYAYHLGVDGTKFRMNDDGEPSGTAGRPIYNELKSFELTDSLLAVVRYFGGTKLGASGLIRAYKESSRDVINNSKIVIEYVYQYAKIHFSHDQMGKVYNSLKTTNIEIKDQHMGMENWIKVEIRLSEFEDKLVHFQSHFHGISKDYVTHESFKSDIKIEECVKK